MPTTTRTVYLTDENGNALIDAQGNMRTLSFALAQGYSYRLVERASIVSATYSQVVGYSTATGQTIAGVDNASEFDVGDFGIVQYAISDRNNTIGYVTCKVTAVGTDSLTVNGIGISVSGKDSVVTDVTAGTPTEQDGYTVTPVTFNFEQGNSETVNIQAKNGRDAEITKEAIAAALGLTSTQIDQLVALSKVLNVNANKVQIAADVEASSFIVLYLGDDFTYTTDENGVTITGLSEAGIKKLAASGGNLVIPPMIDSQNVIEIADRAFSGKAGVTDILKFVTIPDSVTSIGNYAFSGCTGLTSITIPDSVTGLGTDVFSGCTGLTSVTIGNGVPLIRNRAFSGCASLKFVTIPDNVTAILNQAFEDCASLTSVTIGNGVERIGANAFSGCASLKSVTIPDSVTDIGASAFYGCTSLTAINIGNASIANDAFYGCTGLTSTIIGKGVAKIGTFAFKNCTVLTSFAYEGTMAEWASVSKGIDWNTGCPFTVVHCSDGDVNV